MNDILFTRTDDTWDTVDVQNNGDWFPARALRIDYKSFSRDGGVEDGGELVDEVAFVTPGYDPDDLGSPISIAPIFPGRITFQTYHRGSAHHLIVENQNFRPGLNDGHEDEYENRDYARGLRVIQVMEGIERDITDTIMEAHIVIDSPNDTMEGFFVFASRVTMFGTVKEADSFRFL